MFLFIRIKRWMCIYDDEHSLYYYYFLLAVCLLLNNMRWWWWWWWKFFYIFVLYYFTKNNNNKFCFKWGKCENNIVHGIWGGATTIHKIYMYVGCMTLCFQKINHFNRGNERINWFSWKTQIVCLLKMFSFPEYCNNICYLIL